MVSNPFEERLRAIMRQYTEEALEYSVRPVLIIGVQEPGHELYVLHDEVMRPDMVLECLEETLEALLRRWEHHTTT